MQPRISMITLGVSDVSRAVRFYEDGLGFPRLDFESDEVAFFTLQGTWLGIFGKEDLAQDAGVSFSESTFPGFSLAHNLESEKEVDAVMQSAIAAGARLVKKPEKVFWGGYFADPDGYLWELAYNPMMWVGPPPG
ncbi:MAG TPA: glyoxalase [Leptospiraceae bacterium]|nr:glyoxalase [Spirochaetaceae bacterium]HBS05790.1 glyoxalase [Leptospiraceae bacterium]